jgi:transcriptional regulator with GAF, ATPase, and Fis domain
LSGHERELSGAANQLRSKFEVAHKGTMFFDEIADMSPMAQAKILRAIEYGEFERLGAGLTHDADVRIISATNRPLRQLTRERKFREDLYHRLNGLALVLPPLPQRRKDLDGLIAGELNRTAADAGKAIAGIDPDALDRPKAYEGPGNLRELHRVIRMVVLFTTGDTVMPEHVILDDQRGSAGNRAPQSRADSEPAPPVPDSDGLTLETAVRRHCQYVYDLTGNNKRQTARVLGIWRSTL